MASNLLGRTNREFPPVWLSLSLPNSGTAPSEIANLVSAAREAKVPIDVSSGPALWGGHMRAADEATLVQLSTITYENSTDSKHSIDLIQAHLIEVLSSLGREWIDFYFFRIRKAVNEYQISGALEALEMARQEGHIRFVGICCDGPALATLGTWQFHDAFDVLLVDRNHYDATAYKTLNPMAQERRVGIVTRRPFDWGYGVPFFDVVPEGSAFIPSIVSDLSQENPVIVPVNYASQVGPLLAAHDTPVADLTAKLQPVITAFDDDATWAKLAASSDPRLVSAAKKRQIGAHVG